MTKTILILVTLLLVACGGEPFDASSETLAGDGGDATEAGSVGVTAGGSAAQAGGSTSTAGKPAGGSAGMAQGGHPSVGGSASAGAPVGGAGSSGSAGTASAGSSTGGAPVTCDFDVTALTAALPTTITWQDFIYTDGALCVTCRDKPCGAIHVISWGVPQVQEDGSYVYLPNTDMPMISMNIGTNDGMCTKRTECGLKAAVGGLQITVAQQGTSWIVTKATAGADAGGNMCATSAGFGNTYAAGYDLGLEVSQQLTGLKIPCK